MTELELDIKEKLYQKEQQTANNVLRKMKEWKLKKIKIQRKKEPLKISKEGVPPRWQAFWRKKPKQRNRMLKTINQEILSGGKKNRLKLLLKEHIAYWRISARKDKHEDLF